MKLERITIRRAPGIDHPFTVDRLSPGVNLVVGPNGSGKTTLCRAVRGLLWPPDAGTSRHEVSGTWSVDGQTVESDNDGRSVSWHDAAGAIDSPRLPDAHLAGCFVLGVGDLLDDSSGDDRELAARVERQMAGGYDVGAVIGSTFTPTKRHGKKESAALADALKTRAGIQSTQNSLAEDADRLRGLGVESEAARRAQKDCESLAAALDLARKRSKLGGIAERLQRLAPATGSLRGDESDVVGALRDSLHELEATTRRLQKEIDDLGNSIQTCALADGPVPDSTLETWLERSRKLFQLQGEVRQAREDEATAASGLALSRAALDPDRTVAGAPDITLPSLETIDTFHRRALRLREDCAAVEASLRQIDALKDESDNDNDTVRRGVDALRDWLSAPRPRQRGSGTITLLVTGFSGVLAGGALAFVVSPWYSSLAGLGLGALLVAFAGLRSGRSRGGADGNHHRQRFESFGLPPPSSWDAEDVRATLRTLEKRLARADLLARQAVGRDALAERRRALEPEVRALESERDELRVVLGLDTALSDLALTELVRRIHTWQDARREHERHAEMLVLRQQGYGGQLEAINGFLAEHGESAGQDAAEAQKRLESLAERSRILARASRDLVGAAQRRSEILGQIAGKKAATEAVFTALDLDVDDDAGLRALLERKPEHDELIDQKRFLQGQIIELEHRLSEHPDLTGMSQDEAARRHDAAAAEAARHEELVKRIAMIQTRIEDAQAGEALEKATADVDTARQALENCRVSALKATAGRFLLERVNETHERENQPDVLRHAVSLFQSFTSHRYTLQVRRNADGRSVFTARDNTADRRLGLSELSDGTRMQLLIAARLAFAAHAESGTSLPVFLDEALTTADPARFRAIVQSLLVASSDEGRQIFYLTCNPSDVERWKAVCEENGAPTPNVISLAKIREGVTALSDPADLAVPPLPEIPGPDDVTAEQYAVRLGVPRPDPLAPVEALHLFYLLRHDLETLHHVLQTGITTLGQWQSLHASGATRTAMCGDVVERVEAWAAMAVAFHEALRVGHGRRVDRGALERCDAVSATFLDGLAEIAGEHDGDARGILRAFEDPKETRLRSFRARKRQDLEQYLDDEGHLDRRDRLDTSGITTRVLVATRSHIESGLLTPGEIRQRIRELQKAFGSVDGNGST